METLDWSGPVIQFAQKHFIGYLMDEEDTRDSFHNQSAVSSFPENFLISYKLL